MSLLLALLLDLLFGEPPLPAHPVAWMGRFLSWAGRRLPGGRRAAFAGGALAWSCGAVLVVAVAWAAERATTLLPSVAAAIAAAILLWPLFAARMLFTEVASVEKGLAVSLDEGRRRLSRIVSRDVSGLSESEVRESALESLSENLSDSVVAPLLWWAVLGLPGAALHRFANTADACWGYRGEWEWKGKWAARVDDVLNWIPARVTAILVSGGSGLRGLASEAARTPSPNGGWPMGALALRLGVRLGKPGVYVLNPDGHPPTDVDFRRALRICATAAILSLPVVLVIREALHGGP